MTDGIRVYRVASSQLVLNYQPGFIQERLVVPRVMFRLGT